MATRNVPGTYNTIQAGINAAANGDTVLVAAGTYNERVTINKAITVKTTAGAKIRGNGTLVSISAANATLDGFTVERSGWENGRNDIVDVRGNGVTVKNCTVYIANVTNLASAQAAFGKEKASGIIFKSNNIVCENNEVWGAAFGVAFSDQAGKNSVVRNCNLHHTIQSCLRINHSYDVRGLLVEGCNLNYTYGEDGIQWQQDFGGAQGKATISNRGTFVRNCVFIGCGENALDFKGADGHTIENCVFTRIVGDNNGGLDGFGQANTGTLARGSNARSQNVRVRNCVVWNSKDGFDVFGPDFYYYNNTFVWNNYGPKGANTYSGAGYNMRTTYANCGFKNNLSAGHRRAQAEAFAVGSLDIDYNIYCTNGGNFAINKSGKDWAAWLSGLKAAGVNGADVHSQRFTAWSSIKLTNCPEKPDAIGGYDFSPQASSPAYQAGGPLTSCASSGNSNKVPVRNAKWFCDGYGAPGVKGDTITIGTTTATITAINGNTLTINKTVAFNAGTPVYWGATNQPHIGVMDLADLPPVDPDPDPEGDITANFTANKARVETGTTVTFTDTSTATNPITAWSWEVDGVQFSTSQNPTRTFTTAGTFDISLTVTSIDGSDTLTRSDYIEVYTPRTEDYITASFTASPTSGVVPVTVTFTDTSTSSAPVTAWKWKVDGVQFSTSQNPTYTFTNPGSYSISLEATSSVGTSAVTYTDHINVTKPADPPVGGNDLVNGNFADGTTGWTLYSAGGATITAEDGIATIEIASTGGNTQLYQSGLQINAEREYVLVVRARCESDTVSARLRAMRHVKPYTSVIDEDITITTSYQDFSYSGTAGFSDSNGRVSIQFETNGTVYIDSVSFGYAGEVPQPPTPTASDVAEVALVACNTSTGNQTITLSGGLTPTAAMFVVTPAYSGNNPAAGDAMSIGFATSGGAQTCGGYSSQDNVGTTYTARRTRTDACATIPSFGATTEQLRFSIVSMALNQIVINIDTAPAQAYQIEVHAFEATEAAIGWDAPSTTDDGTVTAESGMSGTPSLLLAWTPGYEANTYPANAKTDAETCFGVSDGTNSYATTRRIRDNQASSSVVSNAQSGAIFMADSNNYAAAEFDATGWVMRTKETAGSWNGTVGWLALRFASNPAKVFAGSVPGASQSSIYNIGQVSGYVGALATSHDTLVAVSQKSAWSIGGWDGSNEVSVGVATEYPADPSNTSSRYNAAALIDLPDNDGTDGKEAAVNGNSGTALSVTWTNTNTTATPNLFLWSILGDAAAGGGDDDDLIQTGMREGIRIGRY